MTFIADVAAPWNKHIQFAVLRNRGVDIAAIKASEGNTYTNEYYSEWLKDARDARVGAFPYHFVTDAPAKEQWDTFRQAVGDNIPSLLMLVVAEHTQLPELKYYVEVEREFESNIREGGAMILFLPRSVWAGPWKKSRLIGSHARFLFGSEVVAGNCTNFRQSFGQLPTGAFFSYAYRNVDAVQFTDSAAFGNAHDVGVSFTSIPSAALRQYAALPNIEEEYMLVGELREGVDAVTIINVPKGQHSFVSFACNHQMQGLGAPRIRIRYHTVADRWSVPERITVTHSQKAIYNFPAEDVDMLVIQRIGDDDAASTNVMVAYNVG